MSTDRRRFGVIETRFHTRGHVALYDLCINGETWAQVEWSAARRAWCIQDASGRCLAHLDAIHGQDADADAALRLAKRMILDGTMPTPEDAEHQLETRLARDQHDGRDDDDLQQRWREQFSQLQRALLSSK